MDARAMWLPCVWALTACLDSKPDADASDTAPADSADTRDEGADTALDSAATASPGDTGDSADTAVDSEDTAPEAIPTPDVVAPEEVASETVASGCTAVIIVSEGDEVTPQTRLHLIGSTSSAGGGEIGSYQWSVDEPAGSLSSFSPSANVADPTFEVNVAGRYVFRLEVTDALGTMSCETAEYEVSVAPEGGLHVELVWDTPNDPDQGDGEVGADLDLHFLHPFALGGFDGDGDGLEDGYFDTSFDVFWLNNAPNWGDIADVLDNPSLDRDDTDGVGPEIVNYPRPEDGRCYRVGAHYWNAHGFGESVATVRVYASTRLVFEASAELHELDLWSATRVCWPLADDAQLELIHVCAGTTTACRGDDECAPGLCGLRIAPNYVHPSVIRPE